MYYGPEVSIENQQHIDDDYNRYFTVDEIEAWGKGIHLDSSAGLDGVAIKIIKTMQCYKTICIQDTTLCQLLLGKQG